MSNQPGPAVRPRPSAVERERAANRLRQACADDRLSVQTFAARLELAYSVRTQGELAHLLTDLPQVGRLSGLVLAAVTSISRWTTQLVEAWQEPRLRRLALPCDGDVLLGRSRACDCVIGDSHVSRAHARLRWKEGRWWLSDVGSANGTFLHGWRVSGETEVQPGDRVSFGDARFILVGPGERAGATNDVARKRGRHLT